MWHRINAGIWAPLWIEGISKEIWRIGFAKDFSLQVPLAHRKIEGKFP
jgi:hypothetical protein